MKNRFGSAIQSFRVVFLFFSVTLLFAGCINKPVLLRNRPNVPPPVLEPSDGDPLIAVDEINVIESDIPIINIPESLPPPDIKTAPVTYTVAKGDSFWKIARIYGVSKDELAACNNLSLDKPLSIGTILLIPPGGEFVHVENRPKVKKVSKFVRTTPSKPEEEYMPSSEDGTYTVATGDSLWKIARKFKISIALLIKANNIDSRKPLQIGTKLIIPGAGEKVEDTEEVIHDTSDVPDADVLDDTTPMDDDLLNDAANAADEVKSMTEEPTGAAVEVINELDEAVSIAETETPGSLYTEEVLPNETLQDIADRHGLTPEKIRKVNPGLSADGKLKPFTSIKIPNK